MSRARQLKPVASRAGQIVALAASAALLGAPSGALAAEINSAGPLSVIYIDKNLGCQVQATGDIKPSFFGGTEPGACGTFLALTEASGIKGKASHTLYGSEPLGGGLSPTPYQSQKQKLEGVGTKANPFVLTTQVDVPEPGVEKFPIATVTETDTYVVGQDSYETAITIENKGEAIKGTLYHAGDCLLSGLDAGFGAEGVPASGSVACTIEPGNNPSARYMAFSPQTGAGVRFMEGASTSVWSFLSKEATQFPGTVAASAEPDNGMGLSWPITVPLRTEATFTMTTTILPTSPPTSSTTAGSCAPSGQVPVTVSAINGPKAVDYMLDGAPVASVPTDPAGHATITLAAGQHTLEYWGEDRTKAQESPHHSLAVLVGSAPTVTIASDQGKSGYEVGEKGSVTVAASGVGLTSDPSAKAVPITTSALGSFSVARSASNACGTTEATFKYAVLPPPVLGKEVNVEPVSGKVFVALPPGAKASLAASLAEASESLSKGLKFVPLSEARQIPVGSSLETTSGLARISTATAKKGKLQAGTFGAGIFQLLQRRSQKGLTELKIVDNRSQSRVCASTGKARVAARLSSKVLGRLTGSAHGKFTTRGRFSAATVRGTTWGVLNRCDGTLTRVTRGTVRVRDFVRRRTVTILTGQHYLARAPG